MNVTDQIAEELFIKHAGSPGMSLHEFQMALAEYKESIRAELTKELDKRTTTLRKANDLRPILLKQLGYVPEPVLMFCNEVRAVLPK